MQVTAGSYLGALALHTGGVLAAANGLGKQDEVWALPPDRGLSLYPPPFTSQGKNPAEVARKAVPFSEVIGYYYESAEHLNAPRT